jgi:hypothetical protein
VCDFLNIENISAFVGSFLKIEIEMHGTTMKITEIKSLIDNCKACL